MGPPMVICSPTVMGALMFDMIVVSVGPYALCRSRPGAQRATSSGGQASPPTATG